MNEQLVYYDTGENIFREGELVYINKAFEQVETHLHAHDFIEIAYVASGQGIHIIGEKKYSVSKGDLFIINYNIPHEFKSLPNASQPNLVVYNCIFKPEFLDDALKNTSNFFNIAQHILFRSFFPEEDENLVDIKLLDKDSGEIEKLYEKMMREYELQEQGYIEMLRAKIVELLITIFRLYKKNYLNETIDFQRIQVIQKVMHYIKTNYAQEFKLDDLSVIALLSRNYLCKIFKEHTGMTIFEYAQKIRMEEACQLLLNTNKKVIDVAAEVGYNDVKFFNQVFKRIIGKTPGEYRKRILG